jgi:hypothetical protein
MIGVVVAVIALIVGTLIGILTLRQGNERDGLATPAGDTTRSVARRSNAPTSAETETAGSSDLHAATLSPTPPPSPSPSPSPSPNLPSSPPPKPAVVAPHGPTESTERSSPPPIARGTLRSDPAPALDMIVGKWRCSYLEYWQPTADQVDCPLGSVVFRPDGQMVEDNGKIGPYRILSSEQVERDGQKIQAGRINISDGTTHVFWFEHGKLLVSSPARDFVGYFLPI